MKSYDVALSFAGEDRHHAEALANLLKDGGYSVFYDEHEQATLWGKNIYDHLSSVYKNQARYCVMFLSEHYAQKLWPKHERQSAQARAFEENQEYILPIRLDDTEIPGVISTVGYLDLRLMTVKEIYRVLVAKLSESGSQATRTSISPPVVSRKDSGEFVLLLSPQDQKQYFIPFQNATWDSTEISLELLPESSDQVAFLRSLRDNVGNHFAQDNMLAFALQEDAAWVSPQEAIQTISDSQTVWKVVLKEDSGGRDSGFGTDVAVNNISSDQIAEMRARRILLNERSPQNRIGLVGFANDSMLESYISGGASLSHEPGLKIQESPIPDLYRSFGKTEGRFQKFARLALVLYLKLSNTVEDILQLDLKLLNPRQLQVNFKGRRNQRYTDVEPYIIQINRICSLSE